MYCCVNECCSCVREWGTDSFVANWVLNIGLLFNRVSTTDDDILHFWHTNESLYQKLSQVEKLYLAMSESLLPVENVFSITGLICNSRPAHILLKTFTVYCLYMTMLNWLMSLSDPEVSEDTNDEAMSDDL